jgi:ATP-dependent protease HslVU (ClpYQ) peptidase subunit
LQIPLGDEEFVDITAKILKVSDEKVCVEFNKSSGDSLSFFDQFNKIKEYFGDQANATFQ